MFPDFARAILLAVAGLLIAGGVAGLMFGVPSFAPLVLGLIMLIGVAFERWRYKRLEATPGAGFELTGERFLDPTSREPVRVYANPTTGERRYVRDRQA